MNYSKTSEFAMAESPFVIRPGTVCDIEITYVIQENITWDSSVEFNQDFYEGL